MQEVMISHLLSEADTVIVLQALRARKTVLSTLLHASPSAKKLRDDRELVGFLMTLLSGNLAAARYWR